MSGIKIHSHVHHFVLHKRSKKGSAEQLYCTIQNSASNTAETHGYIMLKTVLSGWFFRWVNMPTRDI